MKALWCVAGLCVALAAVTSAAPPGPIDGQNIPSNFGVANLVATQRNYTGFGDYTVTPGGFLPGSEVDQLFLAKAGGKLYVGLTGNLETVGHAFMIGISTANHTGQSECRAEGEDGPPNTLQNMGRETIIDDNGTPEDPSDDTWSYGANGTIFPCEADYVFSIDTFGGTMYVSKYEMLDPAGPGDGTWDPTPDNAGDPNAVNYATRQYLGSTLTNDGDDVFDDFLGIGYDEGGFDNTNVLGVTDTDGSSAATATTGMEFAIPFSDIGLVGTETISIFVLLANGGEGDPDYAAVTNQVLPPTTDAGHCDPPVNLGRRTDLTPLMDCHSVSLSTLPAYTGTPEGAISASEYGGTARSTQTCPTGMGDQQFDPDGVTRTGGSELDEMYLTSDGTNLFIGLTGNLEENGNKLLIFLDSVAGGEHILGWDNVGPDGLEGDALPPLDSDTSTDALFDYVLAINCVNTDEVYTDVWDLAADASKFIGRSTKESGNGDIDTLGSGTNQWGMQVALNNLNSDGVIGCGFFDPACWFDSDDDVEALAATAANGLEIAVPLAEIGLHPCEGPHTIHVWALITGGGGWRSNQSLPSERGEGNDSVANAGNMVTDWWVDFWPIPENWYQATAATVVTVTGIVNDCNENGIEDHCDILDETSTDANLNGVPDECEGPTCPDGGILDSTPPDGVVDARQPNDSGSALPRQGIGSADEPIIIDIGAAGADASCFALCETESDDLLGPNAITSVTDNGDGTYTLTLDHAITAGAVTTVQYNGGAFISMTSHPGNANGDSTASAIDLLRIIDDLNNVANPTWGDYSEDIDHSGLFAAADLLREIDLLNGAGVFDPWNGTLLPVNLTCP